MSSLRHVRTAAGKQVVLGKELGRGGEGIVYQLEGDANLAVKLYHPGQVADRREKILAMVAANWHSVAPYIAFPIDALFGATNNFVGFTMRKVGHQKPVHNLYSPTNRKTVFPKANFPFLLRTALNISRAVAGVHKTGCVVGDINQSGFLVGETATATLIDCDSFQVRTGGKLFLCKVGVPEFTPPELQGRRFDQIERTANHDSFGLAILLFHLLFMGRHPFAGRFFGRGEMPIERAIAEFRFAYSSRTNETRMEPPPNVPTLQDVPKGLADAFEMSFGQIGPSVGRPKATDWVGLLESVEKELVRCPKNSGHHYFRTAHSCPWCRMEQGYPGFLAFVPPIFSGPSTTPINLGQLIAAIQKVPDPGNAPELSSAMPNFQGSPSQGAVGTAWTTRYVASLAGCIVGIGAFQLEPQGPALGILILLGSLIFGLKVPHGSSPAGKAAVKARTLWQGLEARWKQAADNAQFVECRREADGFAKEMQRLPNEEVNRLAALRTRQRDIQLNRFLERYYIHSAKIKGIGNTRKVTLRSYGIETAADVERHQIEKISGFGPAMVGALIAWRTSIERRFVFDSSQPINPADIAAVKSDTARKNAELEAKLRQSLSKLQSVSADVRNTRAALQTSANTAWQTLKQAELDAETHGKGILPKRVAGLALTTCISVVGVNALTNFRGASNSIVPVNAPTLRPPRPADNAPIKPSDPPFRESKPVNPAPVAPNKNLSSSAPTISPSTRPNGVPSGWPPLPPPVSEGAPSIWPPLPPVRDRSGYNPEASRQPSPPPLNTPLEIKPAPAPLDAQTTGGTQSPPPSAPQTNGQTPQGGPYVSPPNPARSTNNRLDAYWIQDRLRQLGYFAGVPNGNWDGASREALRDFKVLNGLPRDDIWDVLVEQRIESPAAIRAGRTFVGGWSTSPDCVARAPDQAPLLINTRMAKTAAGACQFLSVVSEGQGWRIHAKCSVGNETWNASIKMVVKGEQLVWSSERGTETYTRCR
jgi:DNA-binding helix-hairpin-helix protein with protein kinase domain